MFRKTKQDKVRPKITLGKIMLNFVPDSICFAIAHHSVGIFEPPCANIDFQKRYHTKTQELQRSGEREAVLAVFDITHTHAGFSGSQS